MKNGSGPPGLVLAPEALRRRVATYAHSVQRFSPGPRVTDEQLGCAAALLGLWVSAAAGAGVRLPEFVVQSLACQALFGVLDNDRQLAQVPA